MMEVVVTDGAIGRAKLQSNHYHQQTNTMSIFTGRMPFLSLNQQCQSTEGKISHPMDIFTPNSPGGLPTLSLVRLVLVTLQRRNADLVALNFGGKSLRPYWTRKKLLSY